MRKAILPILFVLLSPLVWSASFAPAGFCDAEGFDHARYPWMVESTSFLSTANILLYDTLWDRGLLQESCLGPDPVSAAIDRAARASSVMPQSFDAAPSFPARLDLSYYEELVRERIREREGGFRSIPDPEPRRVSQGEPARTQKEILEQPLAEPAPAPETSPDEEPGPNVEALEKEPPQGEEEQPSDPVEDSDSLEAIRDRIEERLGGFDGEAFDKEREKIEEHLEKLEKNPDKEREKIEKRMEKLEKKAEKERKKAAKDSGDEGQEE